jgi:AbrB family looped-hinge helix DNA binding protein
MAIVYFGEYVFWRFPVVVILVYGNIQFMANSEITRHDEHFTLEVKSDGRTTLPINLRKRLDLKEGDKLVVTLKPDGELELRTGKDVAKRGRGLLQSVVKKAKGRKLVDELLKERREEARRE